jgi:hypothetical protein
MQQSVYGQSNAKISFQGVLKSANGEPVTDGDYTFTFSLWKSLNGTANADKLLKAGATDPNVPANQWSETISLPVAGGIYSHNLGSVTTLNPANFTGPVFLNIKVGAKDLVPRTEFTYAPFAFSVASAQTVACSGALGDIKYSILPPDKFKDVNGDCWVPMDGRDLVNTDALYAQGITTLPNGGGAFLRAQDFSQVSGTEAWKPKNASDRDPDRTSSSPVGQLQADDNKSHNHTTDFAGAHSHNYDDLFYPEAQSSLVCNNVNPPFISNTDPCLKGSSGTDNDNARILFQTRSTYNTGAHTHNITNSGGTESRPKNLNFWVYIRIN